jgi:hypothetical protein
MRSHENAKRLCSATLAMILAGVLCIPATSTIAATEEGKSATTTEKQQTDLAVTVYNSNIGLVKDVRQLDLAPGVSSLHFEDVASSIRPETVHLESLTDAAGLSVLEQNYEYDLLSPQKLLAKYVGKEVTLVRPEIKDNSTQWVETKALLLADNEGPVWKIGDQIVTGMPVESYKFPDLPENLYTRPTLVWTLENKGPSAQKVEATYLTNDMNWNADYVLTVARDDKTADLNGWVTIMNNSGTAYRNAKLQLVAGDLNLVQQQPKAVPMARMNAVAAAAAPGFAQESFAEFHLYTLDRRTTLADKESKQISLLGATNLPVQKFFVVEGTERFYYGSVAPAGEPQKLPVKVYYAFQNEQKSGLGMPLPAGVVRIYQADSQGNLQFAGEDRISHTPKDEKVRIKSGNAFDVVAESNVTDFRRLAKDLTETEVTVTLRNHKDSVITVDVREPAPADWQVVSSSIKWTKLDAQTIGFSVPVAAGATETLTYRLRVNTGS